jgi:hypothetical protein
MIRAPLLFFLFFLGFLVFLIDVGINISVSVSVNNADFRNISDIGQSLFKICRIEDNDYFNLR